MRCSGPATIVHVINSLDGGGTERLLVALLGAFDATRLRHVVVTFREAGTLAARLPDHVACWSMGIQTRARCAWAALARFARARRAAVIHARNTSTWQDCAVASALTPSARLVLGFHGLEHAGPFDRRQRFIARWCLRRSVRWSSVSSAGGCQLERELGIPRERIDVLRNGVDAARFDATSDGTREHIRRQLGFDNAAFVVGVVGSLVPVKRHDLLIDALAQAVRTGLDMRLLVVGDGPRRQALLQHAAFAGVGSRMCVAGWRDDVPAMLTAMDAYVCSSDSEGMNNAVLEALAAGLPVVVTDVGDNATVVRDQTDGAVVPPGSAAALARALSNLAASPATRARLATAARARANAYKFSDTVSAYESYYQSLVQRMTTTPRRRHRLRAGATPAAAACPGGRR